MTEIENETQKSITPAEIGEIATASTLEVFTLMLGVEITRLSVEVATQHPILGATGTSVVSLIGLTGPMSGTGSVSCTGELACTLASQLLGAEYSVVNDEVLDAVGEITNMIIGNVKTGIEEKVGPMDLSTPAVIFGQIFKTFSSRIHDWLVIKFLCGSEQLQVQMCLTPNRRSMPVFRFPGT